MAHHIFDWLLAALVNHGYWAVAVVLLLENTGLPVPGETVLLLASFVAYSKHELRLPWIILVGTAAAALGDNLGYLIGHYGGRPLLDHYKNFFRVPGATLERGEKLFGRYGPVTIFFARFVFGMRVIAGPLAGVLRMPWRRFIVYNLLGAGLWVTVISLIGFFFGSRWESLMHFMRGFDLILAGGFVLAGFVIWWWNRRGISRP
ncbi:MAG: DedA family protein [Candidatus Sulfotelmatobacter sp.]